MRTTNSKNLVSICIPTLNGGSYLKEALDSIERQTYRSLEVICSDDGSTDDTLTILQDFKENSTLPVTILKHDPAGIGSNWNHCVKNANGAYIKFLFQDDLLEPSCVENMMNALTEDQDIGMVASKRHIFGKNEKSDNEFQNWLKEYGDLQKVFETKDDIILDRKFFRSPIFFKHPPNKIAEPSGILFKKEMLIKTGLFRDDMVQILDVEFYNRVLLHYKILIRKEKLYRFRYHAKQTTKLNLGKDENDFVLYQKLLIRNYFWLLNSSVRLHLLNKHYPVIARIYRLSNKFFNRLKLA